MSNVISPNMNLVVPNVGSESGPTYAYDINASLTIIDAHNHTPGSGVQITPGGLNINSALTFNGNAITNAASLGLNAQGVTPATLGTVYLSGDDLFFVDGVGNEVRITQDGAVAGTPGSIANLVAPATASYVAGTQTFVFESNTGIAGNLDGGSVLLRNLTPNSTYALTLAPPPALSANLTITLPTPPAATSVMTMDSGGTIVLQPANQLVPPGVISAFGGASAPGGYLLCDGSAVSRSTYSNLFGAIATAYGIGDGSTTFNIPDLRGMFTRGVSGASGRDPDAASRTATNGGASGNNVGSTQTSAFASHSHGVTDFGHAHGIAFAGLSGSPGSIAVGSGGSYLIPGATDFAATNISIQNSGGNETRPINVYVNYIIKT